MGAGENTAALSRDHTILIDPVSGLVTVAGGKWTTYRKMAEDIVDQAITLGDLEPAGVPDNRVPDPRPPQPRRAIRKAGVLRIGRRRDREARGWRSGHAGAHPPAPGTPGCRGQWACRREMARTVDDVLARRSRSLLLDARASIEAAPRVAEIMAGELGHDGTWTQVQVEAYRRIASGYTFGAGVSTELRPAPLPSLSPRRIRGRTHPLERDRASELLHRCIHLQGAERRAHCGGSSLSQVACATGSGSVPTVVVSDYAAKRTSPARFESWSGSFLACG